MSKAASELKKQESTPLEIYARDTDLDSIMTCLKMSLLSLLEFIGHEYFAGYRMTPRTFAEALVPLPVTIRERPHEIVYEVAPNPRDPKMMELLTSALDRITSRRLKVRGRRFIARIRDDPG